MHRTGDASTFDTIIENIGSAGNYQKRFYYVFNFFLFIIAVMPMFNLIISLATPDHWCHIPGREVTNFTVDEWKSMYIPIEFDSKGIKTYSKCRRYSTPITATNIAVVNGTVNAEKCTQGWDYDKTWYDVTAPMQNDWVCDNEMNVASTLAMCRLGEIVGNLVFSYFVDNYGRRPTFFASIVTLVFGRLLSSQTSTWLYFFFISALIGSLPLSTVIQVPLVMAIEISRAEDHGYISMLQAIGWTTGWVIMPLLMWWLRHWTPFLFVTTLPLAFFLFSKGWMIESPLWLVSQGKIRRCLKELKTVAKTNGTQMPKNVKVVLLESYKNEGKAKHRTILGLFSSPRLAKNTILLAGCWSIHLLIYVALIINVYNLSGNPFLNYIFQAVVAFPAYVIGKYMCDRYGRRWTTFASFFFTCCFVVPMFFIIRDEAYSLAIRIISIFLKFSITISFYSLNLQSIEIFPTCVRQTGTCFGFICSNAISVLSPYIISMGTSINAIIPYVLYLLSTLFACSFCLFLPETRGHKLPETLADSSRFGANQDFWGREKKTKNNLDLHDGSEITLNVLTRNS